ncbi:MAG: hypothetical protein DHS20C18_48670 [Saprospiraceae bacterium]|nr:MAG: hypothetical protein DHS20C18_48670 [Saprospiraceae bacterium]
MFTRYMFNSMYLFNNPAYSGTHGYWTTNALYRTQWVKFDGAPKTILLGAEGMIGKKQNAGLGGSLYYDKIGLDRFGDFSLNYAYHIKLDGEGQRLSIGIKAGALFYRSLLSQAVVWESTDPVYSGGDIKGIIPRAGMGVFWYGQDHFLGLSVPTLVAFDKRTNFNINLDKSGILRRHYYLYGGYVFHLKNEIDLKPSILLKYQPSAPLQVDFNLNVWFKDVFSVGVSYRTNDAVSVMVEIPLTRQLSIGYAFDNTLSALQNVSSGTHEVMVGYNFRSDDNNPWDRIQPINRF